MSEGTTLIEIRPETKRKVKARAAELGIKMLDAVDDSVRVWLGTTGIFLKKPKKKESR